MSKILLISLLVCFTLPLNYECDSSTTDEHSLEVVKSVLSMGKFPFRHVHKGAISCALISMYSRRKIIQLNKLILTTEHGCVICLVESYRDQCFNLESSSFQAYLQAVRDKENSTHSPSLPH